MLLSVNSVVGITIDVLIVALVAIFALIGLRKGFFKSVLSMISTLVVIIISIIFASPLAKLINKIYDFTGLLAGKLCSGIASMGSFYSEAIPEGVSGKDHVNSIPSSTNGFLKKLMSYVLEPLSAGDVQGSTVADIVSGAFASIIVTIVAGILLFILIKIVLSIASRLFENITRNRVFGGLNKLLGFAFGAVKGFIIVVVFAIVLTLLTVVPLVNTKISPIIQDNTKIARPIYNYTDEVMEKYIIDGKIVQKWIDDLWENKYKGGGNETPAPETPSTDEGTLANPHIINLDNSNGVWYGNIQLDFTSGNEQYYSLDPSVIHCYFDLVIEVDAEYVEYKLYEAEHIENEITMLESLNDNDTYIIKFIKVGEQNSVGATLTLTPVK